MKAQMKAVMASAVVIVLALAAVSGVTYSWFSDTETNEISISTGSINLDVEYSDFELSSYNKESTKVSLGDAGHFPNGVGNFSSVETSGEPYETVTKLTIERMVPGDGISFDMNIIKLHTDLDVRLTIDVIVFEKINSTLVTTANHPFVITKPNIDRIYTADSYDNLGPASFSISMPTDTDNGYQNKNYSVSIIVKAIQEAASSSPTQSFKFIDENGEYTATVTSKVYGNDVNIVFSDLDLSTIDVNDQYNFSASPSSEDVLSKFGPTTQSINFKLTDSQGNVIPSGFTAKVTMPVGDNTTMIIHQKENGNLEHLESAVFSTTDGIKHVIFETESFSDFVLFNGEISDNEVFQIVINADIETPLNLILENGDYSVGENGGTGGDITFIGKGDRTVVDIGDRNENYHFFTGSEVMFRNILVKCADGNNYGLNGPSSLSYDGCTLIGLQFLYAPTVTFNNCTFDSNQEEHSVWTYGSENISFRGCDFVYEDRCINVFGYATTVGQTVTFTDCSFNTDNESSDGAVEINSFYFSLGATVILTDCDDPDYGHMAYVSEWDSNDGEKTTIIIDGISKNITDNQKLSNAIKNGATKVELGTGSFIIPDDSQGKTITFVGNGETSVATQDDGSYEGCDYSLDGATVTFDNITITTDSATYTGYARLNATYNDCTINGTYTLYGNSVFNDCTFNVSGDVYNIWTWGAPTVVFNNCTFNSDGKALLLYGTENTKLKVNNCTFNDNGGLADLKAAIEIGNDYNKTYELIVKNTTVNGYEINDKGINTGTTLWANKNSMTPDNLNVIVDDIEVY